MIKVALALYHRVLPPTLNVRNPNPGLGAGDSPFFLNAEPLLWGSPEGKSPRRGAVSSFGFGGTNFHIILEEYPDQDPGSPGRHDVSLQNIPSGHPSGEAEPGARNGKKRLEVALNGFRYLSPATRARRDRALHEETTPRSSAPPGENLALGIFDPSDSLQREKMSPSSKMHENHQPRPTSGSPGMNQTMADRLEGQESLDRLQAQFHANQAGYIDLLSRYMERQYALIEKIPSSPQLDKIFDSFNAAIQLLDRNQQRYHDNHDRYLENQLHLLNARSLFPERTASATMPRVSLPGSDAPKAFAPGPGPEKKAPPSDRQWIPLRSPARDVPNDANPYSRLGKDAPPAPPAPEPSRVGDLSGGSLLGPTDKAVLSGEASLEEIIDKLRDIVADKTGYPKDMLEMDMDLEADMGIDSIKRLEILAAMQEEFPNMPMELEGVGEQRTLREVAAFLSSYVKGPPGARNPGSETSPAGAPASYSGLSGTILLSAASDEGRCTKGPGILPDISPMLGRLRTLILEKSGFPPEMLTEDLDLDNVGLDIVQWIDIIAVLENEFPDVKMDLQEMDHLHTLGEIERHLCGHSGAEIPGNPSAPSPAQAVDRTAPVSAAGLSPAAEKADHPDPGPSSAATFASPYQVVISTAALEAGDSGPRKKRSRSVVKKKLTEPDRILSIPGGDQLWVVMDEGEGVGPDSGP